MNIVGWVSYDRPTLTPPSKPSEEGVRIVKVQAVIVWDGGDDGGLALVGRGVSGGEGVAATERYGRAVQARKIAMKRMEEVRRGW